MTKIRIVKVTTSFSELGEAANRSWGDIQSADAAIRLIERSVIREKNAGKKFGYYKTDFILHFADGNTYSGRYDIGDGEYGFSNHVRRFAETYGGIKKPYHFNDQEWENFKKQYSKHSEDYRQLLENYEI